jgi:hypothetical protein
VRHYYPYEYANLERHRKIAVGSDPLWDITPPDRCGFVDHAMDRIPNVLKHTRSEELFASGSGKFLSELEGSLHRALGVQLVLQDEYTNMCWKDLVTRCQIMFPECFRELEAIRKEKNAGHDESARKSSFHLFRSIEKSVQDLLAEKERRQCVLGPSAT